jgi:phosphoglycerate dehydrogenase-like enzyme
LAASRIERAGEAFQERAMARPLIVVDPSPRWLAEIFDAPSWERLQGLGEVVVHEGAGRMPAERFEALLPQMELLIGQSDMPKARLDRAGKLRAIVNVETNFLQNVDYETCFERGIHVLAPSSAFARPVAEMTLGMAIDLCRGVTAADRAMRAGREQWLLDGAVGCFSLYGASVGLVGFGDLAHAFTRLLAPFQCPIKAYDPWISDHFMAGFGVAAATLDEVLSTCRVIVVFAAVTSENRGFLGRREFELIQPGSVVLLMSRAGVVDFPEFLRQIESGRFRAASDVFPLEPAPADDPARRIEGLLLSPHRAGALPESLLEIGRQTVADAELVLRGLPPLSCRRAQRETVARSRSKPVEKS